MNEMFDTLFEKDFAVQFKNYVFGNSNVFDEKCQIIDNNKLYDREDVNGAARKNYVVDFIMRNRELLMAFHHKPTRKRLSKMIIMA